MTWAQLVTFNVVLIVAIASPGPAILVATQTSLSAGCTAGIAVGAGLGLMAAIWTMMALLGFGVVFELFPFLYVGAKAAGAAYLLYIAYRMWRSAGVPATALIKPGGRAFRQGFLVNLFNPKSVLFAAAARVSFSWMPTNGSQSASGIPRQGQATRSTALWIPRMHQGTRC